MKKIYLGVLYTITALIVLSCIIIRLVNKNLYYNHGTVEVNTIDTIQIEMTFGKVEIYGGDKYQIEYKYINKQPDVSVNNGNILIEYDGKYSNKKEEVIIVITVPTDKTIKEVKVDNDVVDLEVEKTNIEVLNINCKICDVSLKEATVKDITIKNDVSNIMFKNSSFNKLNINSDICNIKLRDIEVNKYNYQIKANTGMIEVLGEKFHKEYVKDNAQENSIEIECRISNITIN